MNQDDIMSSILNSVKVQLGIEPESLDFDPEIMMHINSAIMTLRQLGVGPEKGFMVVSSEQTYEDYLGEGSLEIPMVKIYFAKKVKLGWDSNNSSSYFINLLKDEINELEWRLSTQVDYAKNTLGGDQNGI